MTLPLPDHADLRLANSHLTSAHRLCIDRQTPVTNAVCRTIPNLLTHTRARVGLLLWDFEMNIDMLNPGLLTLLFLSRFFLSPGL